jgi:hypothetical protein
MQDHPLLRVIAETLTGSYDSHIRIEFCEIVAAIRYDSSSQLLDTSKAAAHWLSKSSTVKRLQKLLPIASYYNTRMFRSAVAALV